MSNQTNTQILPNGNSSLFVADYIICEHGCNFTPFQLIKMIYMAHGLILATTDKPLIHDRIEAWKHGPVIPLLYHELKRWGDMQVPSLNYCGTEPSSDNEIIQNRKRLFKDILTEYERDIIDLIVKHYRDWSFTDLRRLCHQPGTPWDKYYNGEYGVEIPDASIKEYYKKELERTG